MKNSSEPEVRCCEPVGILIHVAALVAHAKARRDMIGISRILHVAFFLLCFSTPHRSHAWSGTTPDWSDARFEIESPTLPTNGLVRVYTHWGNAPVKFQIHEPQATSIELATIKCLEPDCYTRQLQPRQSLKPNTRYVLTVVHIPDGKSRAVGEFLTTGEPDLVAPVGKPVLHGHYLTGHTQTDAGQWPHEQVSLVVGDVSDNHTHAEKLLYAIWLGSPGKKIDFARDPDGYLPASHSGGREVLVIGGHGADDEGVLLGLPKVVGLPDGIDYREAVERTIGRRSRQKASRIGVRAMDTSGNMGSQGTVWIRWRNSSYIADDWGKKFSYEYACEEEVQMFPHENTIAPLNTKIRIFGDGDQYFLSRHVAHSTEIVHPLAHKIEDNDVIVSTVGIDLVPITAYRVVDASNRVAWTFKTDTKGIPAGIGAIPSVRIRGRAGETFRLIQPVPERFEKVEISSRSFESALARVIELTPKADLKKESLYRVHAARRNPNSPRVIGTFRTGSKRDTMPPVGRPVVSGAKRRLQQQKMTGYTRGFRVWLPLRAGSLNDDQSPKSELMIAIWSPRRGRAVLFDTPPIMYMPLSKSNQFMLGEQLVRSEEDPDDACDMWNMSWPKGIMKKRTFGFRVVDLAGNLGPSRTIDVLFGAPTD